MFGCWRILLFALPCARDCSLFVSPVWPQHAAGGGGGESECTPKCRNLPLCDLDGKPLTCYRNFRNGVQSATNGAGYERWQFKRFIRP